MKNSFLKILILCILTLSMCLQLTDCSKDKQNKSTESLEENEPLDEGY